MDFTRSHMNLNHLPCHYHNFTISTTLTRIHAMHPPLIYLSSHQYSHPHLIPTSRYHCCRHHCHPHLSSISLNLFCSHSYLFDCYGCSSLIYFALLVSKVHLSSVQLCLKLMIEASRLEVERSVCFRNESQHQL